MSEVISKTDVAAERISAFVSRVERLEADKDVIAKDIKEVYLEAKGSGFDVPTLRKIVALRRKDKDKRDEELSLLELYMSAIGM